MEERVADLERRVGKLESSNETYSTRLSALETQQALNMLTLQTEVKRGEKIDANVTWFWRILLAGVTTAFLGWVLSGGLVVANN